MSAVGFNNVDYCVKSNCFGYGKFVEKEPGAIPLFVVKMLAANLNNVDQKAWANKQFKTLMTERFIPISCSVVVVNKNIFSRILNFIVRIFAFIFCKSKNYVLVENPTNDKEVLRINKKQHIDEVIIKMRKLANCVEFINMLPTFMPDLIASLPSQEMCLKNIQWRPNYTEKEKEILKATVVARYQFFEQVSRPGTQAERIASLEQFIPHYRRACEVDLSKNSTGFTEVLDVEMIPV